MLLQDEFEEIINDDSNPSGYSVFRSLVHI
jgi:hypothetical protein